MTTFIGHKIPNEIIEQVNNIPILKVAEVLGIKVKGSKAICFSGHDTIPSLSFSSSKNLWHCFGCSRGGANIQLVMSMNPGFNFVDAVTWLCQSFNINLCYRFQMKRNIITRVPLSKSLHLDIQQLTKFNQPDSAIYEWFCERIPLMNTGCQYLFKRGLSNKTLKYFRVCELKDINKIQFEAKKKWTNDQLLRCGLFVHRKYANREQFALLWWDHCIIFPFYENGRIVYLQARHLNGNVKSKYIGLVGIRKPIFNLDLLKKIKQGSSVYLCEGVIDAMSAVQLGLPAIAVLGASSYHDDFTKILLPFNVHIIPDSDAAGLKLLNRVRDAFAEYGRAVSIVNLGKQKDVNEYLVERTL